MGSTIPFGKAAAHDIRKTSRPEFSRQFELQLYGAPWVRPDPLADLGRWSVETLASAHEAIPAGVLARHGTGVWAPVPVPDLIGVE